MTSKILATTTVESAKTYKIYVNSRGIQLPVLDSFPESEPMAPTELYDDRGITEGKF
jgi:hypothetical protein